ncbi:MAG: OmpA family protein [Candidatus Kapabacteria bacterium]|nr:OmpA family protein [Candidatus Kapabacteria bacterium]
MMKNIIDHKNRSEFIVNVNSGNSSFCNKALAWLHAKFSSTFQNSCFVTNAKRTFDFRSILSTILVCFVLLISLNSFARAEDPKFEIPDSMKKKINTIRLEFLKFSFKMDDLFNTLYNHPMYMRYGAFGGFGFNYHIPTFKSLDTATCPNCTPNKFSNFKQYGFQPAASLLFEYELSGQLGLSLRAGYTDFGIKLSQDEPIAKFDPISNSSITITNSHIIETGLTSVTAEPTISFRPLERLPMFFGAQLGFFTKKTYHQYEEITQGDALWANGSKIRNETSGTIPGMSAMITQIFLGFGYEIPLNKTGTSFFVPEISIAYGPSNITDKVESWKIHQVRAGLALKISPYNTIDTLTYEIRQQERINDSIILLARLNAAIADSVHYIRRSFLAYKADINRKDSTEIAKKGVVAEIQKMVNIDEKNQEIDINKLNVEQFTLSSSTPLVKYVFFDHGKWDIPARYTKLEATSRASFAEANIATKPTLEIYHNIINIIGKRMSIKPSAQITITGCNDGIDSERNDTNLSYKRAESISNYLQNTWKIPAKNIIIKVRNLPEFATSNTEAAGVEENRRVEFEANDPSILAPVNIADKIYSYVKPTTVRTYIKVTAGAGIKDWGIRLSDEMGNEKNLGAAEYAVIPPSIEWDFQNNQELIPTFTSKLNYYLYVQDNNDKVIDVSKTLDVNVLSVEDKKNKGMADKVIENYSILMPFNISELTGDALATATLIKDKISGTYRKDAEIKIKGYADALGSKAANIELAKKRANIMAQFLGQPIVQVAGEGINTAFDDLLPEGRFYNRSVNVTVNNPIR